MSETSGRTAGWQQPPEKVVRKCPHFGLLFAAIAVNTHREGHQWVCTCGQVFMVVSNGGKDKRLVPDSRTPTPHDAPTEDGER